MNYCGIDLANKTSAICIIDEQGKVLREVMIETESGDVEAALKGHGSLRVIIEASPLAEWVSRIVESGGHEAIIIDPRAAKHLVSSKKKTDARDARTLAQIGRSGWYTEVHRKSAEARTSRSRLQARQALVETRKAIGSTIRGLLRAHGLRLGEVSDGQFSARVRQLVKEQVPLLEQAMEQLLRVWKQSFQGAQLIKQSLQRESRADEVRCRLETVPGVGPLVSTVYQSTIDDPHRFRRAEEVADYTGLAPRIYQSGEVEYRGRITKEGDSLLRWHLVEAAHVLLHKGPDCALKRWGLKLQKSKGSAKAKVAVARKLAILLWKLWKEGATFEAWPKAA